MTFDMTVAPMAGILEDKDSEVFDYIDTLIERSIAVGDPLIALEYVQRLQKETLVKGLAIAKVMFKMRQNWSFFEVAGVGDTFENLVEATNGYAPATVEKYVRMWESIFENDKLSPEIKNRLSGRPIRDLLLLTAAAREGSLSDADWDKVLVAGDSHDVRNIVRKARGEVTSSKNAVLPILQIHDNGAAPIGTVYGYDNGVKKEAGNLNVGSADLFVQKIIARLVNGAHMKES